MATSTLTLEINLVLLHEQILICMNMKMININYHILNKCDSTWSQLKLERVKFPSSVGEGTYSSELCC